MGDSIQHHLITSLSRKYKILIVVLTDILMLFTSLLFSFFVRLGEVFWPDSNLLLLIMLSSLSGVIIFYVTGLYKSVVRYIDFNSLW